MPRCFTLTKKGSTEPSTLNDVDVDLCNHFGVPVDPDRYYHEWYNSIGLSLSCGHTFEQMKKKVRENLDEFIDVEYGKRYLEIVEYLDQNYVSHSWYEQKR